MLLYVQKTMLALHHKSQLKINTAMANMIDAHPLKQKTTLKFLGVLSPILLCDHIIEAKRMDLVEHSSVITDYVVSFLKITLACSPIILIAAMLLFAREDEEEEKAKLEAAKKSKSCKS